MLVDASFLALVALAAAREIVAGRNWKNLNVVALVSLLLAGNVAFHLEAHFNGAADNGIRAGIAVVIAADLADRRPHHSELHPQLAGARKSRPAAGAVRQIRHGDRRHQRVDAAAVDRAARRRRYRRRTGCRRRAASGPAGALGRRPHVARASACWCCMSATSSCRSASCCTAAAAFDLVAASAGIHAWMVGAAGIMTLAVMTRATLGHTGQAADGIAPDAGDLSRGVGRGGRRGSAR